MHVICNHVYNIYHMVFRCKEVVDCFEGSTDVRSSKKLCPCGSNLLAVDLSKVPCIFQASIIVC